MAARSPEPSIACAQEDGFLGPTVPQRRGSEMQQPLSCFHRQLAGGAGTSWNSKSTVLSTSPAEMDAGGHTSYRQVRSSGSGCPTASGIVSLGGQEQGTGGS